MASAANLKELAQTNACIPIGLHRALGEYFSDLEVRIFKIAAERAEARMPRKKMGRVSAADLEEAARHLFENAAVEFAECLRAKEILHVQRNAS